ncbi:MAG: class I fructose-bisphosphate aldolase [Patescibacteria group bacterium]
MTLHEIVQAIMKDRKGVLAVDENTAAIEKRFSNFDITCTEDTRRAYRELLFATEGIEGFLSTILLSEEGIKQSTEGGIVFSDFLAAKNIFIALHLEVRESDDIPTRIQEYKSLAVVAVKRRLIEQVENNFGSGEFRARADGLAEFARTVQSIGLVPIVGFELEQASTHSSLQAEDALTSGLSILTDSLEKAGVDFRGLIIETSMAGAGSENPAPAEAGEVAERTVRALSVSLKEITGGVLFFSDGETAAVATAELNAIARLEPFPWPVAFCFSRALQDPVLAVWQGKEENKAEAQAALYGRLSLDVAADVAGYSAGMELR